MECDSYIDQVKKVIKSLVITRKDGISMRKLCEDFEATEGENIPYARFGYKSLTEFLTSSLVNDIVYLQGRPHVKVFARHSESSAHIQKLVQEQHRPKGENNYRQRTQAFGPFECGPLSLESFELAPDEQPSMSLQEFIQNQQIEAQAKHSQNSSDLQHAFAAWNANIGAAQEGRVLQVNEPRGIEELLPAHAKSDSGSEIVKAKPATRRDKLMQALKKAGEEAQPLNELSDLMVEVFGGDATAPSDAKPERRYPEAIIPPPCESFHDYRLVKISELNNPHKFWIQFKKQKFELTNLMRRIQ